MSFEGITRRRESHPPGPDPCRSEARLLGHGSPPSEPAASTPAARSLWYLGPSKLARILEASMSRRAVLALLLGCLSPWPPAPAAAATPSKVLTAANAELARSMRELSKQPEPPYFLSYEITHTQSVSIEGAFGVLTSSDRDTRRLLDIDLRVGSYELDNTHPVR